MVTWAGLPGLTGRPALVVSVNYFGTVALVRGLQPQAPGGERRAPLVLLASNSITGMPGWTPEAANLCMTATSRRRARSPRRSRPS